MLDYQLTEQRDPNKQEHQLQPPQAEPTVALLHCMDLIDDFLDHINWSLETFCNEFTANWMYGYTQALQRVGVRTVIFCISARVSEPSRFKHVPTGSTICVIPASKSYLAYRALRRRALSLYGGSKDQSFKDISDASPTRRSLLTGLKNLAQSVGSYQATPLGLLARELKREGCSAILCQEYEYPRFDSCVLLGRLTGLPIFATFQGGDEIHSWLEYPFRRLAFWGCTGLIIGPQTEIGRVQSCYGVPDNKIARIFNPLDVADWPTFERNQARAALGIPQDAQVVVYHGRIDMHRKGLDILLDAWDRICRDRPDTDLRLLLLGSGPDADTLSQRIADMQLRGVMWRNQFVSDRTIIQQHLSAADVYTLPSRQEGFPIAPIEAMASGLPVVAADAPGVPDILENGEFSGGLVVPREDSTALASALKRVLDDEAWRQELSNRARRRVEEHFSPEAVGPQLRDFLLGRHK